jgi:AraC family ethanolamine operon transcriptional activator
MDDGVPIRFNGVERDRSVIVIGRGGAAYNAVEKTPRQFASIIFTSDIGDRGWPQTGLNFKMFETSVSAQHSLRSLVLHALSVTSQPIEPFEVSTTAAAIKESLLAAIDAAFADVVPTTWASRANSTRKFKVFMDLQAALASRVGSPIYSGELARQIGVPVRTMHDAVQRYRGMSLHRYLRLWRLWHVRRALLAGAESVKACALAFGFWHMGDFSKSYRLQFGETPSETLAKSR